MTRRELALSEYNTMWVVAMFDLPVDDCTARRRYTQFRNLLLDNGFFMLQYSVYARCCDSEASGNRQKDVIASKLPSDGNVRLLMITDRQFAKMEVYRGKKRLETEEKPRQLELF